MRNEGVILSLTWWICSYTQCRSVGYYTQQIFGSVVRATLEAKRRLCPSRAIDPDVLHLGGTRSRGHQSGKKDHFFSTLKFVIFRFLFIYFYHIRKAR